MITERTPIRVLAAFDKGRVKPLQFRWGTMTYHIKTIELTYSERKGRETLLYFGVSDGVNAFRLAYASESQEWFLEQEAVML
jgi:hypothetical protein